MAQQLDNPFYYLDNFEFVLNWVEQRYADVLGADEAGFIQQYRGLPQASRALLARMVMRRGVLFRHGRLRYAEIGDPSQALAPLVRAGWVSDTPALSLQRLFGLFTKAELLRAFAGQGLSPAQSKGAMLERLLSVGPLPVRPLRGWWPGCDDEVCELLVMSLCERFRLMFFGNLRQDWSEFVLADLGLLQYETVSFSASCRALGSRQDVDDTLHLHACSERLHAGEDPQLLMGLVPVQAHANRWIERRRAKLLFRIGQACERAGLWQDALAAYSASGHGEARSRRVRVLERTLQYEPALLAAEAALDAPASEAEAQQLARMHPRLRRKLGLPVQARPAPRPPSTLEIQAPRHDAVHGVEELARRHLHRCDAPAHYVENTLVNALFGLLCWDAIFAPLPGAFFHPFQRGPADLREPDFAPRRKAHFDACLAQLDSGQYRHTIQNNFAAKAGLQCSFVHWPALDANLLRQALRCIPPGHLKKWFARLLADVPGNRSGFPDLIQFWPAEARYRMVEVKGPGDRLQDNQKRWLAYFAEHDMPVAVCFVRWAES